MELDVAGDADQNAEDADMNLHVTEDANQENTAGGSRSGHSHPAPASPTRRLRFCPIGEFEVMFQAYMIGSPISSFLVEAPLVPGPPQWSTCMGILSVVWFCLFVGMRGRD